MDRNSTIFKTVNYIFWILFVTSQHGWSQIPIPMPGNTTDLLAVPSYTKEKTNNFLMMGIDAAGATAFGLTYDAIHHEYNSLTSLHSDFALQKAALTRFIYNDSYGYIKLKYPLIPRIGYENNNAFGNVLTRVLFLNKLRLEKQNINNYCAGDNPITEGQRIFLSLCSVQNVLRTILERPER